MLLEKETDILFVIILKKNKERRGRIYYQLQNMEVYVLPQQGLSPFVTVEEENNELIMSAADYQIICDEMM